MDVTEPQRRLLTDELTRMLGVEATTILMAHLPPNGVQALATREDIAALRAEMATKDDLKGFATKDDLKGFATKEDLTGFATKDDLKRFATKDDIRGLATREELADLRRRTETGFDRVEEFFRLMIERMTSLEGHVQMMGESFRAEVRGELLAAITSQTRALIISLISALAIVSALAFAVATNVQP